jgi:hypothetical protein
MKAIDGMVQRGNRDRVQVFTWMSGSRYLNDRSAFDEFFSVRTKMGGPALLVSKSNITRTLLANQVVCNLATTRWLIQWIVFA